MKLGGMGLLFAIAWMEHSAAFSVPHIPWRNIGMSGVAKGGFEGQLPSHFRQDCARNFLKIDENIGVGKGAIANPQRSKGRGQTFSFMSPTFTALATPLIGVQSTWNAVWVCCSISRKGEMHIPKAYCVLELSKIFLRRSLSDLGLK